MPEPLKKVSKRADTQAGLRPECRLGPREQFNEISSLIDGGVVYSNEPELLHQLRHGCSGDGGGGGGAGGGGGGDPIIGQLIPNLQCW